MIQPALDSKTLDDEIKISLEEKFEQQILSERQEKHKQHIVTSSERAGEEEA